MTYPVCMDGCDFQTLGEKEEGAYVLCTCISFKHIFFFYHLKLNSYHAMRPGFSSLNIHGLRGQFLWHLLKTMPLSSIRYFENHVSYFVLNRRK